MKLYGRSSQLITLSDALQACAHPLSCAIALLYSPTVCQFAQLQADGQLNDSSGSAINLSSIFEARVFNADYELRWLNQSNGKGTVILLSEKAFKDDRESYLEADATTLDAITSHPQQYLIWGKGTYESTSLGWSTLATSRIGALHVPIVRVTADQRVYLLACEYLNVIDDYGNVAVVEERLIGLEAKK
jgi:CRISPR-associated protein (TIGR03984 family)